MLRRFLLSVLLLSVLPLSAFGATIVFDDTFDAEPQSLNKTNFLNWDVIAGSVDLISCGGSGGCVDLDGSSPGNPGAIFQTKTAFNFLSGEEYSLDFSIPTGAANDGFFVSVGAFEGASFSGYSFPLSGHLAFSIAANGSAKIQFLLSPIADNVGPYLTEVSLTRTKDAGSGNAVPEPASLLLLATAGSLGAWMRRRRA